MSNMSPKEFLIARIALGGTLGLAFFFFLRLILSSAPHVPCTDNAYSSPYPTSLPWRCLPEQRVNVVPMVGNSVIVMCQCRER
jgi:hypothetical protein